MKFIIKQILIALTLIAIIHESKCDFEFTRSRLSRVYEKLVENNKKEYEDEIENEISRAYDMDCVKTFFNLPQNSKMMVNEFEEMIFLIATGMKCSDEDKIFENQFDGFVRISSWIKLSCIKLHLQKFEPTSKLIKNFEISEVDLEECKKNPPVVEMLQIQQILESTFGPLNIYTCGAVSENALNDFITFLAKGALIKNGDISVELRKSEKEKLKKYFKDVSIRTVNCIIKRFEDDPQAFLINDTLNYYFKKELSPTDNDDQNVPNGYYMKLVKLEETIDYDCVKEKLKIHKFGNKTLLKVEAKIIIASAKSQCIKVDPLEFSNLFIDFAVDDFERTNKSFNCAKYKLQKLEPTSKLAGLSSSDDTYKEYCRYFGVRVHPFSIPTRSYKRKVGRLNETTCGVVTDEFIDVISLKTVVLFNEKDKKLKDIETMDLFGVITEKLHKLADCILERIK